VVLVGWGFGWGWGVVLGLWFVVVEAGKIIGIPFHDHIIIAGEEYVSLAQKGYV
jgi:hypothetical protein